MVHLSYLLPSESLNDSSSQKELSRCFDQCFHVFTVEPANQERLVELLIRATDGLVNKAPGFISSTLHRSIDGTKATMYAQWRSAEDYQAMRQNPEPLPFLQEALTIATSNRGICRQPSKPKTDVYGRPQKRINRATVRNPCLLYALATSTGLR
jgi:quinol monooxygenase YgiN